MNRLTLAVVVAAMLAACTASSETPQLRVLCSNEAEICQAWAAAFTEHTGIEPRFVRLPTSEAFARIQNVSGSEFDVWHGGPAEFYVEASQSGLLERYVPAGASSISADLKDPQGTWTGTYASLLAICVNREALNAQGGAMPRTWEDLLDPALRGKISAPTPLASGTAFTTMALQVERLGDKAGRDYLLEFYRQVFQFTRSGPAAANVVASGEAPVGVTFAPYCQRYRDTLSTIFPSDGTTYELGAVAVLAGSNNPDLARAYVDFAVSERGQRAGAASGIAQIPTHDALPGNLAEVLGSFPNLRTDLATIQGRAAMRPALLDWFRAEVGPGA